MILDSCNDATQLQRERSRADIALRANLERNAAIGEKIHECRIIYRSDAVAYPFGAEELDGLSNFFWAANFAGVDDPVKPLRGSLLVYRPQFFGGHAQFIAANAEGDDGFRCTLLCSFHNAARGFGSELANPIENPVHAQPAALERLGRSQDRLEVAFRALSAQQHDANRDRHFGIHYALR